MFKPLLINITIISLLLSKAFMQDLQNAQIPQTQTVDNLENPQIPDQQNKIPTSNQINPDVPPADIVNTPLKEAPDNPTEVPNTPDTPNNTPNNPTDIPNNTPEIPNNTPDIPNNTPDIPNNTPEIPNNTPEIPNNTPEIPNNTPNNTPDIPSNPTDTPPSDIPNQNEQQLNPSVVAEDINNVEQKVQYKKDGVTSKTDERKQQQISHVMQLQSSRSLEFQQYTFEVYTEWQFYIHLPVDQEIIVVANCYVEQQNHYKQISLIEDQRPVRAQIIKDSYYLQADKQFYFSTLLRHNGIAGHKYTIKFLNQGSVKLIAMQMKHITSSNVINDKLGTEMVGHYAPKIQAVDNQFQTLVTSLKHLWFYDFRRMKDLADIVQKYYIYQIAEMIIALFIAIFQTRLINKMLKSESII